MIKKYKIMEITDFNFSQPIQIRWNDLDALGHVNNAVYVTYFEVARGYFMLSACPGWNWRKDMFLIANVQVDYKKELLLTSQDVRVHMKSSQLGNKSFVLEYVITSKNGEERIVHAVGSSTQIMFDMTTKSTIEIPDWVRESLSKHDNLK